MATAGDLAKPLDPINAFDFAFSQPFLPGTQVLRNGITQQQREHSIPFIHPSKPIFVDALSGETVTLSGIRDEASKLATGLRELLSSEEGPYDAVSPVVLVHLPNSVHFASIVLGILASGFTGSLASPALTSTELEHIISLARPAAIITTEEGYETIRGTLNLVGDTTLAEKLISGERIFIHNSTGNRSSSPAGAENLTKLLRPHGTDFQATRLVRHSFQKHTALILWSSGTTGKSKGVCLSHENLIHSNICMWHIAPQLDANERWLGVAPFYHIYGLAVVALMAPACGATVYVMPKFDPKLMLDLIEREKLTALHVAPPVALLLAKSPLVDGRDCKSLKFIMCGAAPLGREVVEMLYKRIGIMIFMGYGSSEAGTISQQYARSWDELVPQLGDCGKPEPGNILKVVSTEDPKRQLRYDEEGEIVIKSPAVFIGYLNNPSAMSEVLDEDGWYRTGDVGKIDTTGALWITDRLKEMIKVKAFQVAPADLEDILCASPDINDAGVAKVFSAEAQSEYPRAYLVPANQRYVKLCTEAHQNEVPSDLLQLAQRVRMWTEQRTAKYKWLRGGVVFVPQVPKSPSGKILRRLMKDLKGVEVHLYDDEDRRRASRL
ncbi:MAG: hypothetical protein Q9159_007205 [Coniocarpon cinnabarinum]